MLFKQGGNLAHFATGIFKPAERQAIGGAYCAGRHALFDIVDVAEQRGIAQRHCKVLAA